MGDTDKSVENGAVKDGKPSSAAGETESKGTPHSGREQGETAPVRDQGKDI